jgi:hypothetical protein
VKDYPTKAEIACFDSSGDLYSIYGAPTAAQPLSMVASVDLWHQRLGYSYSVVLSSLLSEFVIPYNRDIHNSSSCGSCQQGKHVCLQFSSSSSSGTFPFELLHCDLWTSPIKISSDLDIILSYWMIFLTLYGILFCAKNPMCTPYFLILNDTLLLTFCCLFALFIVIMVKKLQPHEVLLFSPSRHSPTFFMFIYIFIEW